MHFADTIKQLMVKENQIALIWLGQAGFLIKTNSGMVIAIDPYLSDYVNRIAAPEHGQGFCRMSAPVFVPGEVDIDILFCSHHHPDHLDLDALPALLQYPKCVCYTTIDSVREASKRGLDTTRFQEVQIGEIVSFDEFKCIVTDCDHGLNTPNTVGFVLDFGFVRIYYSGDTCYNRERLKSIMDMNVDVALLPINGAFGNLDAKEAAQYAHELKTKLVIPHHFWMFPMHEAPGGTPLEAIRCFPKYAPECELYLTTPGQVIEIKKILEGGFFYAKGFKG